jgi:hypothetical protein
VKLALFLFLLAPLMARAEVEEILSAREIAIPLQDGRCEVGATLAIFSQDGENDPLGFAEITGGIEGMPSSCRATVVSHSRSALIRVKDRAVLLDLKERNANLPGRYDLLREDRRSVATRYKPLVYAGYLFGQTAATLAKGEFLAGPFPLAYGITDRLQIDTSPALFLTQVGQLGGKYQFFRGEDIRLAFHVTGVRFFNIGKGSAWAELQYDSTSNGRSMTHTKVRYTFKLPDSLPLENRDKEKQGAAEITTVYEWVLPSWHRILLGPKFTAGEVQELGFLFTALFLYRHFHWTVNLEVNSLQKIDFPNNKQAVSFDFFWRF